MANVEADLPALHVAADAASLRGQRRYLLLRGAQLVAIVTAALFSPVVIRSGSYDVAGIVVFAAFLAAFGLQYVMNTEEPERTWYDGRAAAESVKDLAWRYAMRAEPFLTAPEPDAAFIGQIQETLQQVSDLTLPSGGTEQITDWMRRTRAASLEQRRDVYVTDRLDDQMSWYTRKAADSITMRDRWQGLILVLAAVGALGGGAKALGVINLDSLGLVSVTTAAAAAWLQAKQYESLAVAYGVTAQELAAAKSLARGPVDDASWSKYVNDAEAAVSREHTLWRASRTTRKQNRR